MGIFAATAEFASGLTELKTRDELFEALSRACHDMGFRYFALSHHVDFAVAESAVRIHNYPPGWEEWYDANRLALADPIHRASHRSAGAFFWRDLKKLIGMTSHEERMMARGQHAGFGDGVTVPANVPGEARGTCTFVAECGETLAADALFWAQGVGMFAFEGARRVARRPRARRGSLRISERQRQCIALAGRGMTYREIAAELGIGKQTVMEHFREARAKCGVRSKTELVVRLINEGLLCIADVTPARR